jgi:hypothetical protein
MRPVFPSSFASLRSIWPLKLKLSTLVRPGSSCIMVFHARCYCHAAVWLVEAEIAPSYFKTRLVYQVRYRLKSWARFFKNHSHSF